MRRRNGLSTWRLFALPCATALAACGGGETNTTDPITTGTITVTVTADGSPKEGVTVGLYTAGGGAAVSSLQTSQTGQLSFADVEAGSWDLEITVPSGFALTPGQTARQAVTVTAGQASSASFSLEDTFTGQTVEALGNLTFSQPNLVISAGTSVRWINASSSAHTVTPDGHSEWSSANIASEGSTFVHTFNTPGTFPYYCAPHQGSGMTGTVTVN